MQSAAKILLRKMSRRSSGHGPATGGERDRAQATIFSRGKLIALFRAESWLRLLSLYLKRRLLDAVVV